MKYLILKLAARNSSGRNHCPRSPQASCAPRPHPVTCCASFNLSGLL